MRGLIGLLLLLLLLLPEALALLLLLPTLKVLDVIPPPVEPLLKPPTPSIFIPDIVTLPPFITTPLLFSVILKGGNTGGLSGSTISAQGHTVLLVHVEKRVVPLDAAQAAPPNKGSAETTKTSGCSPVLLQVAMHSPFATKRPTQGHGVVSMHGVVARMLPFVASQGCPAATAGVVIT
jgi:hypothetical protein